MIAHHRSWTDPLLRAIIGIALGMAVVVGVLAVVYGPGPVLGKTPWFIPMMHSFAGLAAFAVAFLAFGRYQVLRDPTPYWIGQGFLAFAMCRCAGAILSANRPSLRQERILRS